MAKMPLFIVSFKVKLDKGEFQIGAKSHHILFVMVFAPAALLNCAGNIYFLDLWNL